MFTKDTLPILGILRGVSKDHISQVTDIFVRCGISYAEITMNTPGAADLIGEMVNKAGDRILIGAGTVLDMKSLDEALNAGARFIVTPALIDDVMDSCARRKIPFFPGALTPTEIHKAWKAGATMVKLFPGGLFGPGYIKVLKAPLESIKIMAVGGVNEQTIAGYFKNGADAVAFGAGIIHPEWLEKERFDLIEEKLNLMIKAYKSISTPNVKEV